MDVLASCTVLSQSRVESVFTGSSAGEEFACNAGDSGSIPGSGRSPGEGIGYPLQYSWASLEAQMVKNPPAMQETWVRSLGWADPLEEGMATHSSILAWRISWTEEPGGLQSMRSQRVRHNWVTKHSREWNSPGVTPQILPSDGTAGSQSITSFIAFSSVQTSEK